MMVFLFSIMIAALTLIFDSSCTATCLPLESIRNSAIVISKSRSKLSSFTLFWNQGRFLNVVTFNGSQFLKRFLTLVRHKRSLKSKQQTVNFFERWEENVPTETVTSLTNFGAINVFFVVSFSLESPHRSHPKNISLTSTHNKVEGTTEAAAAAARTPPVTAEASSTKTDTGQRRFAARNPVEEVKKGTRSGGSYEAQKGSFYL